MKLAVLLQFWNKPKCDHLGLLFQVFIDVTDRILKDLNIFMKVDCLFFPCNYSYHLRFPNATN